jgi:large subunit ribosomal protein LP0
VKPFKYGLEVLKVYEGGSLFDVAVLDITDEDLMGAVGAGLANVAALSMAANYPTLASIPHSVINGYKNVLAIALETDYSFPLADKVREGTQAAVAAAADADAEAWPSVAGERSCRWLLLSRVACVLVQLLLCTCPVFISTW